MSETLHTCPTCQTPNFTERGLRSHKCKGANRASAEVEIVTDAEIACADLRASAERINQAIDLIKGHEDAFEDSTLEHRLVIGLEIVKAQQAFGMTNAQAAVLGGQAKAAVSTVDTAGKKPIVLTSNPLGFSNWLTKEIPSLKRATAYRYATAFNALGLSTEEANASQIRKKIKDFRHEAGKAGQPMPTLAILYKQGKPAPSKEPLKITAPPDSPEIRLQDAREAWFVWREKAETMINRGILDDLDKPGLEQMKEFQAWLRDRINARLKSF